jgi:hypothetical protein
MDNVINAFINYHPIFQMGVKDPLSEKLIKIIYEAETPLETKEIEEKIEEETRIKIFNRLKDLRGEGIIKGKMVGAGKGTWIWWKNNAFFRGVNN